MSLCPKESSSELESIERSELMEAQHADCLPLDSGDVDDHVAGPDELVQAPLGDTRAVFFEGLLARTSLRNADTTSTDVSVHRTISGSSAI